MPLFRATTDKVAPFVGNAAAPTSPVKTTWEEET